MDWPTSAIRTKIWGPVSEGQLEHLRGHSIPLSYAHEGIEVILERDRVSDISRGS